MSSTGDSSPPPPTAPTGAPYEIRTILGKNYGCFATKAIKSGTRILADEPLLVVPVANYLLSDIQKAFEILSPEQQALYFTLHSGHGQDPKAWPTQIHHTVSDKERQRILEQHNARLSQSPSLISIFQTNCMEMNQGAAVFPHAARFNHSCNPNACFAWNSAIGRETVHAMHDIAAGEEITISYCDMSHDKTLRSWELKHYGFDCDCRACVEDEDDESTFAYQSAGRRFRLQELDRETRYLRGPNLEAAASTQGFIEKLIRLAALYQQEGNLTVGLAYVFLDIALICELKGDLRMAGVAATRAATVKRNCQGKDFPDFEKFTDVVYRIKAKMALQEKAVARNGGAGH